MFVWFNLETQSQDKILRQILVQRKKPLFETTKMSILWKTNEQDGADPYKEIIIRWWMEGSADPCYTMDGSWEHNAKEKKPDTKGTYWMIPLRAKVQIRQIQKQKVDQWLPGIGGEGGGWKKMGNDCSWVWGFFLRDGHILKLGWWLKNCEYMENHWYILMFVM